MNRLWLSVLLTSSLLVMASWLRAAESGGRLVYSERQPLLGFEPVIRANVATTRFSSMIFEPLLERKRIGVGTECRLCERYDVGDRIVTFYLRKGVLWHDGLPMTAEDVAFSFRAVANPETGSALARELENIEDVTVLDDLTVSFTLRQPVAVPEVYFLALPILPAHKFAVLAPSLEEVPDIGRVREARIHNCPIFEEPGGSRQVTQVPIGAQLSVIEARRGWVNVKIIGKGPVGKTGWLEQHVPIISARTSPDFLVSPIGTGPYRFAAATLNGDANLKRWDRYHSDVAFIEQIRRARSTDVQTMVTRLTSEIIDLIPEVPLENIARVTGSGVARIIPYPSLRFVGMLYNTKHPLLAQKAFRQALTYGTNRPQWLETFYQSQGSLLAGPAGPDTWLYDSRIQPLAFDMDKAKELLGAVPHQEGLTLNLIASNDRSGQDYDMLKAYTDALRNLGIEVKTTIMEPGVYSETLQQRKFDIALVEYQLSYGYNFRPLFEAGSPQNYGDYSNEELGTLFDQWRIETDFEKIRDLAYRTQVLLAEDCPYTFLWSLKSIAAVNNKVRKIGPDTIDPYRFFAWIQVWWIPSISQ